ncbi:MAG: hypothetical protein NTV19_16135, partial [Burkholderiales bacterium]|nr:hypothetical protein [Burkholderiales bacterium]
AASPGTDDAFLAARLAANQGQLDRFEAAAAQVTDPTLQSYLRYWRLKFRLNARGPGADGTGADAEAQAFIASTDNPLLADLARRDWLYRLARRSDWPAFETQYNAWVLRDEPALHCYAGLARTGQATALTDETRDALFQPRELGDGCGALIEALARSGTLKRGEVWRRLKLALEAGASGSVRRLGAVLDLPAGSVEAALQRPAIVASPGASREAAVIALGTLARQDPEAAAREGPAIAALPPEERAWVWSQIGAHSMRKLAPVPVAWLHDAQGAQASDETWAWLVRAALRAGDWTAVHALVEKMSAEGRRDPTWVYWHARAHQMLGRKTQANAQFRTIAGQFHFYGQLAGEELGEATAIPVIAPASSEIEIAEVAGNAGFARALRFYQMGLRPEGNREWNFQLRSLSDRQLIAAARFACERRVLDRCVNTADRTRTEHDFSLRFVTPFRPQLEAAAAERGLDPAWGTAQRARHQPALRHLLSARGARRSRELAPAGVGRLQRRPGPPAPVAQQAGRLARGRRLRRNHPVRRDPRLCEEGALERRLLRHADDRATAVAQAAPGQHHPDGRAGLRFALTVGAGYFRLPFPLPADCIP